MNIVEATYDFFRGPGHTRPHLSLIGYAQTTWGEVALLKVNVTDSTCCHLTALGMSDAELRVDDSRSIEDLRETVSNLMNDLWMSTGYCGNNTLMVGAIVAVSAESLRKRIELGDEYPKQKYC